jgi:hypothetical protein
LNAWVVKPGLINCAHRRLSACGEYTLTDCPCPCTSGASVISGRARRNWYGGHHHGGTAVVRAGELAVVAARHPGATRPAPAPTTPGDSLTDPAAVTGLLIRAGATAVRVETVMADHPPRRPDDFWTIVLGSGYRAHP